MRVTSYMTHKPVKFYSVGKLMCSDDMRNLLPRKRSQCDLASMGQTYLRTNINLHSIEVYVDDTVLREKPIIFC